VERLKIEITMQVRI